MKVVKKKSEGAHVLLNVTVSTGEVSDALDRASYAFCQQMGVHPEPGKSPAQMASEQLGIKDLDSVVVQQAMEILTPTAVDRSGVIPAFLPTAQLKTPMKRGRTLQFDLDVVLKPRYELDDYSPVKITVDAYTTDESEIDAEIARIAENNIAYVATDPKPLEKGDCCLLKIEASQNGEPMTGLTTEGRTYQLGEGLMPEGFDEGILGMEPGDTRSFSFEGPGFDEDYNMTTETVDCTVTLVEIQKQAAPVINDEWVKTNMPMYTDLADMRRDIGRMIDRQRRMSYDDYVRNVAASALAERFKGKIDDDVYEGTMRELQRNLMREITQQGMTWEQFLEQQGGEQQVSMMLMMQTRQQLIIGFSLDALYRKKGLTYTDDDIKEICVQMNPQYGSRVREQMESMGFGYALRESAARLAAGKYLVEHADITLRDPNAAADAETSEAAADAEASQE